MGVGPVQPLGQLDCSVGGTRQPVVFGGREEGPGHLCTLRDLQMILMNFSLCILYIAGDLHRAVTGFLWPLQLPMFISYAALFNAKTLL